MKNITEKTYKIEDDVLIITRKLYIENEYIGYINYSINHKCKNAYIININLRKQHRKKGYGSLLLKNCLDNIKSNGIEIVKLNDISERSKNPNNIYIKFGFIF